ncbi:dUTP diphosphatase [Candidatus Avelusimicrobium faecicola]|jgi:dUTP pyrophosphatase|uniref:dUTP diphosphatase n=1 Tax=Candidatus Avelusimicrobium faecicola TaxID=3416205 RepID=UPI002A62F2FA|nr:dUTP diphosphatase [Spirochaetota bacterium]MCI7535273.1 dUTP diphosphatase [Spirochaetota bacterium]MDE3277188.1 dUTP diphosphatase [Spirochaetota bacterium]MDY2939957.1 dUTP diphosphatase [Elusimicrobiaceae bacterium]MDY6129638.1 dUTP diphosphatase [Elusimicrobiaceae bacterium]
MKVKKLSPLAKLPQRAHPTDSGADLFALERTVLPARAITKVHTGIAVELPENTSGIIWGKSSVESKGIKAMAGLVDAPYRGELIVCMYNLNEQDFVFEAGQKVAQLVVLPTLYPAFEEVSELTDTSRGEGGFGSTGVK